MVDLLLNMQQRYSLWLTGLYQMGEVQALSWQHCLSIRRSCLSQSYFASTHVRVYRETAAAEVHAVRELDDLVTQPHVSCATAPSELQDSHVVGVSTLANAEARAVIRCHASRPTV